MATTTYTVRANGEDIATRSNKAKAVELATAHRNDNAVDVQVVTGAGKEVFSMKAPKRIRMSKPYTRVVDVPEGVTIPEGLRPAYHRPRRNALVLHDFEEGYRILNTKTGKLVKGNFPTSRAVGQAMLSL
jgi:hypothetical protein